MSTHESGFAFETPGSLIGYTEMHAETPRALMRMDQIAVLGLVAGMDKSEEALGSDEFVSLHLFDIDRLIQSARDSDVGQEEYEEFLTRWAKAQEEAQKEPSL